MRTSSRWRSRHSAAGVIAPARGATCVSVSRCSARQPAPKPVISNRSEKSPTLLRQSDGGRILRSGCHRLKGNRAMNDRGEGWGAAAVVCIRPGEISRVRARNDRRWEWLPRRIPCLCHSTPGALGQWHPAVKNPFPVAELPNAGRADWPPVLHAPNPRGHMENIHAASYDLSSGVAIRALRWIPCSDRSSRPRGSGRAASSPSAGRCRPSCRCTGSTARRRS